LVRHVQQRVDGEVLARRRQARLLYMCTDNGDWAHRRADSPLLRAHIRSPTRHGYPAAAPRRSTQQCPGLEVLAPQGFPGQVKEDPSITNERFAMPVTLTTEAPATPAAEDPFALDLQVIADVPAGHPLAACKGGTDDGCDPTCASACITGGV
jgi:FxLD family lantipeptide